MNVHGRALSDYQQQVSRSGNPFYCGIVNLKIDELVTSIIVKTVILLDNSNSIEEHRFLRSKKNYK